ncbi:hypothetical protein [Alienimonas chondri]|nr:hypothetical protein [Alienimonas chondri]
MENGDAVLLTAVLDAGEVLPGMFLNIPLNSMLNLTLLISSVAPIGDGLIRLTFDCDDSLDADLLTAFNFEAETLWVTEVGED